MSYDYSYDSDYDYEKNLKKQNVKELDYDPKMIDNYDVINITTANATIFNGEKKSVTEHYHCENNRSKNPTYAWEIWYERNDSLNEQEPTQTFYTNKDGIDFGYAIRSSSGYGNFAENNAISSDMLKRVIAGLIEKRKSGLLKVLEIECYIFPMRACKVRAPRKVKNNKYPRLNVRSMF